jgi:hypothetical protein
MLDGKKSTAEADRLRRARDPLPSAQGADPVESLENSIKALTPVLEVRSRRVGGATYQVPVEVPQRRARTLAVRWLVEFARNRREKTMAQRLGQRAARRAVPAGRRVQAQGRHLPHGAGQQGLRALPLVIQPAKPSSRADSPDEEPNLLVAGQKSLARLDGSIAIASTQRQRQPRVNNPLNR